MKAFLERQTSFILAEHFLRRYFDSETQSGELRAGIPAMLGLAAAPGLVACALLFDKYSTLKAWFLGVYTIERDVATLPDKYIFLTLAFVVSGLATAFKWDSLFPDREDYMILAPLPLRPATIFAAKFAALSVFVLLFAIAVNIAGTVFFPPVILGNTGTAPLLLQYFLAHFAATMAASLAGALLTIVSAGLLLNILPVAAMRRASSWFQFGLLVLFLTQLFLAPQIAGKLLSFHEGPAWRSLLFPPMWFVGLYEQVLGRSSLELTRWATWSSLVLPAGVAAAVVLYVVSYFRHFSRTAETATSGVSPGRLWRLLRTPKDPREAAIVDFVKQTIARSALHRMILRVFLGLGCAVILQGLVGRFIAGIGAESDVTLMVLAAPMVVSFFLLAGLRVLLEIPVDRAAAWVFHIALDEAATRPALRAVRRVLFELGVVSWLLVTAPLNMVLLGQTTGIVHTVFSLVLSILLMDILLYDYRKVPFTTPMNADRTYMGLAMSGWFAAFLVYSYATTSLEAALLSRPVAFSVMLAVLLGGWRFLAVQKEKWMAINRRLDLSDTPKPVVLTLDLQA